MAYKLPPSIFNRVQLTRLQRQLERIKPAAKSLPESSDLQEFLSGNGVKDLDATNLPKLRVYITDILSTAPQISVILAVLPNGAEQIELVEWLRSRISPNLLVHFVQNDDLLAGCVIRTDRSVYDLSLRNALWKNQDQLVGQLHHV